MSSIISRQGGRKYFPSQQPCEIQKRFMANHQQRQAAKAKSFEGGSKNIPDKIVGNTQLLQYQL